jgi:eukaryotic-like serine/threonine-protein kinase
MDNANPKTERNSVTATAPTTNPADDIDWTGQVLGEFRIQHRLGKGGMGQVYLAEQTSLKRKVALKLLNPELAVNENSRLRFEAEAKNVAQATHANIVQIYTIGAASGVHYIALEYVEGKNLREFIEKKGPPELSLGLHIMMQVAAALHRAGELGIIHRDIKPENILLTKKGEVKVADFGLSRLCEDAGGEQLSLTQSGITMGTPLYMSPEQVERRPVDSRTDIYSFGVTCYHMFAGQPPFRGNSPVDVAYQHVHSEAQLLSDIRTDLPAELCAIVRKMMAKKQDERYQSAGEIVREVNRLREGLNLGSVAAVAISSSFAGAGADPSGRSTQAFPGNSPKAPWLLRSVAIGGVLLALAAGLGFGWYQNRRNGPKDDLPVQVPPRENGDAGKKPTGSKTDEKDLLRRVQDYSQPTTLPELTTGMVHARELGEFYIKERRPDDAAEFFAGLTKADQKVPAYRMLGKLGHAIALAYKDEAKASNDEFLAIVANIEKLAAIKAGKKEPGIFDEVEGYRQVWKQNPPMREMTAKALDRNFANDEKNFPADKLETYRHPPRPTLKPAP